MLGTVIPYMRYVCGYYFWHFMHHDMERMKQSLKESLFDNYDERIVYIWIDNGFNYFFLLNVWALWLYTCYMNLMRLLMFEPSLIIKGTWELVLHCQGYGCKNGIWKSYVPWDTNG